MLKKYFLEEFDITRKDFFIAFFVLFNTFTWWYMTQMIIDNIVRSLYMTNEQNLIVWALYYTTVIGSSIIGSILSDRVRRLHFLYLWMILGTAASLLPTLLNDITVMHVLGISFLWGTSFGLGMPSCLAYFADCTLVENRGRMSGVIFLATNLSAPLLATSLEMFGLTTNGLISAIWRGVGLVMFFSLKPKEKFATGIRKRIPFTSVLHNKTFLLYLIPWLMFCFINGLEDPILRLNATLLFGSNFYGFILMIESIILSIFAFVGGLLSDWIGRKRMVLYGFVSLGIGYAIIGIAPTMRGSWYFFGAIDGIAGGIFMVAFILMLWGDLSQPGSREKYYVIGSTPFFLTDIVRQLSFPYATLITVYAAFSLAAFFLFVAVLPLMYAPETLPEKKIELRRLRKYLEKAKKIREKHVEKGAES